VLLALVRLEKREVPFMRHTFALFGLLLIAPAWAADPVKVVNDKLGEFKGNKPAKVEVIKYRAVPTTCPDTTFVAVFYARYPVARAVPEGLAPSTLFAVKDGKATVIKDQKELEAAFAKAAARCGTVAKKKEAARAYAALAVQLHQDLFYTFKLMDDSTKVAGDKATAKMVVMRGGNGELNVTLTFDKEGKVSKAAAEGKIRPGPRPRCHATKLLDPDPVVRAIVEQDLLIMGKAAGPYLKQQRQKASPELRKAIDRIWERILDEER
jgi:hypothetical protein